MAKEEKKLDEKMEKKKSDKKVDSKVEKKKTEVESKAKDKSSDVKSDSAKVASSSAAKDAASKSDSDKKTTVEDYNKVNTAKYDKVKDPSQKSTTGKKSKKSKDPKPGASSKRKRRNKRLLLLLIYILIIVIAILFFMHRQQVQITKQEDLVNQQFESVDMKVDPVKEDVNSEILTNDAAMQYAVTAENPDQPIGYIYIPNVNMKVPLYQGKSNGEDDMDATMHYSAGHEPGSYLPGEGKQIVVSGHREEQFADLKDVKNGDLIVVVIGTKDGKVGEGSNTFLYEVYEEGTVKPSGDEAIEKIRGDSDEEDLRLYTCYPFVPFTPITDRYYVKAKRVTEYSEKESKSNLT